MIVEEYQPRWARAFAELGDVLAGCLGEHVTAVHHVGSTSIPQMLAKPILDVDLEVRSVETIAPALMALGYIPEGERGIAGRFSFGRQSEQVPWTIPPRTWMKHHLYVCPAGSPELRRHLHFRDSLVASTELRQEYRSIKLQCIAAANGDPKRYQAQKDRIGAAFFERILSMPPLEQGVGRGSDQLARVAGMYQSGQIDDAEWYRQISAITTRAYLAADNPRAQSGHSGDEAHWTMARSLVLDAMPHAGTFLDVGCASGYLMESVQHWGADLGVQIEPHGLEIAPELADLARRRLPHWAPRIHTGNALHWRPPRRFDYVRTGLYAPLGREADLIRHLLDHVVAPGGRLILGVHNEPGASLHRATVEQRLAAWGFLIAGRTERPHRDPRLRYRACWIQS